MDRKEWSVVILTSNKFLAKLQIDLFRQIGVQRTCMTNDPVQMLKLAWDYAANIVILDISDDTENRLQAVKSIRQLKNEKLKRLFVFAASNNLTAGLVEKCRIIGANAAIGIPHSRASLINTIEKVIAKPKPFVEGVSYVGPCRRTGILSVGAVSNRRKADANGEAKTSRAAVATKA